ncbi:hypothetical protein EVAR_68547_1 [Eumeta japonica]|uniref:Uncharacterized protein n=1 Tax=Eumeta variegata TaxID=151549 RepID=A0A4C2A1I2_EUMVA|nr:hypothetical protein EVAR_68547_1 [Eumeta japonica]
MIILSRTLSKSPGADAGDTSPTDICRSPNRIVSVSSNYANQRRASGAHTWRAQVYALGPSPRPAAARPRRARPAPAARRRPLTSASDARRTRRPKAGKTPAVFQYAAAARRDVEKVVNAANFHGGPLRGTAHGLFNCG